MNPRLQNRLEQALELFLLARQRGDNLGALSALHPELSEFFASFVDDSPPAPTVAIGRKADEQRPE